jgi:hypothetical protein
MTQFESAIGKALARAEFIGNTLSSIPENTGLRSSRGIFYTVTGESVIGHLVLLTGMVICWSSGPEQKLTIWSEISFFPVEEEFVFKDDNAEGALGRINSLIEVETAEFERRMKLISRYTVERLLFEDGYHKSLPPKEPRNMRDEASSLDEFEIDFSVFDIESPTKPVEPTPPQFNSLYRRKKSGFLHYSGAASQLMPSLLFGGKFKANMPANSADLWTLHVSHILDSYLAE